MKKLRNLLLLLILCIGLYGTVCMAAEEKAVYDQAALLTAEEITSLNELSESYRTEWEMNLLIVTSNDTEGKTTEAYADDFYDSCFQEEGEEDGILYLIDMEHRTIYISTSGRAIRYLTDQRLERLLDDAYGYAAEGDYYGCFVSFLQNTGVYIEQGIVSGQYNYDIETGEKDYNTPKYRITTAECLIALGAALVSALGMLLFIKAKYQLKFEDFHYDAYTDSEVQLYVKEDRLINTVVTHRRIPRNDESSGGSNGSRSSVHHSTSGRSHGGGGRSF